MWREGKWLDLWSVVHFLSGMSVAIGLSAFQFGFYPTLLIATLLFIAYELWEAMEKIEETPQNRFMDVVVGVVSYLLTIGVGIPAPWTTEFFVTFFVVLALNVTLALFGWRASQKAAALEKRMLARFEERRARFRAARERRRVARMDAPARSSQYDDQSAN